MTSPTNLQPPWIVGEFTWAAMAERLECSKSSALLDIAGGSGIYAVPSSPAIRTCGRPYWKNHR